VVLMHLTVRFPYVHDLTALLILIEQRRISAPEPVREAGRLTRFAVVTRDPGIAEPVTQEEYERAVAIAATILDWAEEVVRR
jgi:HEPN domain-containing protein